MEPHPRDGAEPAPADDTVALSVLGPAGVLDLVVPVRATAGEVAGEYARQAGLSVDPELRTELGRPVDAGSRAADLVAGDLLVATPPGTLPSAPVRRAGGDEGPDLRHGLPVGALGLALAAGAAVVAAWYAARLGPATGRTLTVNVLLVATLVGVLPVGRLTHLRSALAPVFGGAAAYVVLWDARPDTEPVTWGVAALAAGVTAAVGRVLLPEAAPVDPGGPGGRIGAGDPDGPGRADEPHVVWMVGGALVFLVVVLSVLAHLPAQVVWVTLLVLGLLAARLVPIWSVSVPDQLLVDLERLAVSAWSAREQPSGRRGRMVIARPMVARIARRGQRLIAAASIASAVVTVVSARLLLGTDLTRVDRIGTHLLVLFAGGGLLFAAGSYRNRTARLMLRAAGLAAWLLLALDVVPTWSPVARSWVLLAALVVGGLCVVSAVATGRGWRSVWWARRAEVGEACCGAFAIAAATVACGAFRVLWQLTSR